MREQIRLTGQVRLHVKKRFLRRSLIVLQAKVEHDWQDQSHHGLHVGTHHYWRNATPADFEELKERHPTLVRLFGVLN